MGSEPARGFVVESCSSSLDARLDAVRVGVLTAVCQISGASYILYEWLVVDSPARSRSPIRTVRYRGG